MSAKHSIRGSVSPQKKDRSALCTYTFADGRCCRTPRHAAHSPYCFFHARKLAQARAAEEFGRAIAGQFSGAYVSACDLSYALSRLFAAAAQGQIKPKTAATLAYLGQVLLQTIRLSQDEFITAFGADFWRTQIRASFAQAASEPLNPPIHPSPPLPATPPAAPPPPQPQPQSQSQAQTQPQAASTLPCRANLSPVLSAVAPANAKALAKGEASAEVGSSQHSSPSATAPPSPQPKDSPPATQASPPTPNKSPSRKAASPSTQPSKSKNKEETSPAKNEAPTASPPSPAPGDPPQPAKPERKLPRIEIGPSGLPTLTWTPE